MLELKSVSINYGAVKAVHSASLEINKGELVALLGANGAGKTSIINAISGAVPISAGEIVFLNERINGLSPARIASRGIIQVPEGRRIFPFLTVGENLMVGAYLQKDKKTIQQEPGTSDESFSNPERKIQTERQRTEWRATADAGLRPGLDGQSNGPDDG